MSVSLNPSNSLGFPRPLTQLVKRTLTITNPNSMAVAFKVKTTAPKLYCVRPNSGKVEPGTTVDIAVMLQAMKEEPPLSAKCKDKFLIQSTVITPEKEQLPLTEIWGPSEGGDEAKVYQQKLKVTYLPQEGQTVLEEDEGQVNQSVFENGDSKFGTVRSRALANGLPADPISHFGGVEEDPHVQLAEQQHDLEPDHPMPTPPPDTIIGHEEAREEMGLGLVDMNRHTPPPPSPPALNEPIHPILPEVSESQPQDDLYYTKYMESLGEIERLRALLAAAPPPPSPSSTTTELRRRHPALSEDGESTFEGTEFTTTTMHPEDGPIHVEGVPLQVVAIIAVAVFITTYLFF